MNGNVESEPVRVALLNGKTNTVVQIKARFKLTSLPEEQTNLHIRVRFLARGEQHTFDVLPKITMKKMVEEKSTSVFDDYDRSIETFEQKALDVFSEIVINKPFVHK